MMTRIGTIVSFSQPSAHIPSMKPNRQNETQVKTRKLTITSGWAISMSTKKLAVARMMAPMITDFVAAAPTYPSMTSPHDTGADSTSKIAPVNFGK